MSLWENICRSIGLFGNNIQEWWLVAVEVCIGPTSLIVKDFLSIRSELVEVITDFSQHSCMVVDEWLLSIEWFRWFAHIFELQLVLLKAFLQLFIKELLLVDVSLLRYYYRTHLIDLECLHLQLLRIARIVQSLVMDSCSSRCTECVINAMCVVAFVFVVIVAASSQVVYVKLMLAIPSWLLEAFLSLGIFFRMPYYRGMFSSMNPIRRN